MPDEPLHNAQSVLRERIEAVVFLTMDEWELCYYDVAGVMDAYLKQLYIDDQSLERADDD